MKTFLILFSSIALAVPVLVAADDKAGATASSAEAAASAQPDEAMVDGVIRRISKGSNKLTVKHGPIKNLDMPPMTMSFDVADEKMLEKIKKGDKIRFKAASVDGKMVITELLPQ